MTRKHFELIAKALKESGATLTVCRRMADDLKTTNPRFNWEAFMKNATYKGQAQ